MSALGSGVSDSATPWTEVHQVPLSMGSPGRNTAVGCHALLQGNEERQRFMPLRSCQSRRRQVSSRRVRGHFQVASESCEERLLHRDF